MRSEVGKALAHPDLKEKFGAAGAMEPYVTTAKELAALIKADYAKYGAVVRSVGVKVD